MTKPNRGRARNAPWIVVPAVLTVGLAGSCDSKKRAEPSATASSSESTPECRRGEMKRREADLSVKWRAALGADTSRAVGLGAGVVAVRGEKTLVVVDAESGQDRFRKDLQGGYGSVVAGGTVVTTEMREGGPLPGGGVRYVGELVGFDVHTGQERWRTPIDPHVRGLLAEGGHVYLSSSPTASKESTAVGVDAATGKIAWRRPLPPEAALVTVGSGRGIALASGEVIGIELGTGEESFREAIELIGPNEDVVVSGELFYLGFPWRFEARKVADGSLVWKSEEKSRGGERGRVFASGERVVLATFRVLRHTNPPHPVPGDMGTTLLGFGERGKVVFTHQVGVGAADPERRPASSFTAFGGRVALVVEDKRLQVFSLCDVAFTELELEGAYTSGLSMTDDALYWIQDGDTLVRAALP